MNFDDPRLARLIEELVDRRMRAYARNELPAIKYGVVADSPNVETRKVSVYLDGQGEPSGGFAYSGSVPVLGDHIRVGISPRGDRYVDAILKPASVQLYDVREYGAIGNDNADDAAAIQAACDAADASGGGIVFFPAGTYTLSRGIRLGKTTSLWGVGGSLDAGLGASRLRITHATNPGIYYSGTAGGSYCKGFSIAGLVIETAGTAAAIRIERAVEYRLEDIYLRGTDGGGQGNGIELVDCFSVVASNVRSHLFVNGSAWLVQSTGITQPGQILLDSCAGRYAPVGFDFDGVGGVMDSIEMRSCIVTDCTTSGVSIHGTGGHRNYRINDIHIENSSTTNTETGILVSGNDVPNVKIDGAFLWGLKTPINISGTVNGLTVERVYANTNGHAAPAAVILNVSNAAARAVDIGNIINGGNTYGGLVADASDAVTRRKRFAGSLPGAFQASANLALAQAIADVAGATVTATPIVNERWIVVAIFDFNITVATAGLCTGTVDFDGAGVGGTALFDPNNGVGRATVSTVTTVSAGAGVAHTVKLRAQKANATGTATAQAANTRMVVYRTTE